MRKILLLLLAFVSLTLTLKAQTQSLEDMKLQLEQTDTLYEAEKYDEVLEICLSIGAVRSGVTRSRSAPSMYAARFWRAVAMTSWSGIRRDTNYPSG